MRVFCELCMTWMHEVNSRWRRWRLTRVAEKYDALTRAARALDEDGRGLRCLDKGGADAWRGRDGGSRWRDPVCGGARRQDLGCDGLTRAATPLGRGWRRRSLVEDGDGAWWRTNEDGGSARSMRRLWTEAGKRRERARQRACTRATLETCVFPSLAERPSFAYTGQAQKLMQCTSVPKYKSFRYFNKGLRMNI